MPEPYYSDETTQIYHGDALAVLRELPEASVNCCVTSPPYWGLRDYGVEGQLGLEKTPDEYIAKLVEIFSEVRRVLTDDATLWLNLGDSYAGGGRGGNPEDSSFRKQATNVGSLVKPSRIPESVKAKDLVGIPWRVALALQQPRYTGSIKDERDRIWLAAMLDAEGCMFIHKRKAGQHAGDGYLRQSDTFSAGLEIANTSEAVIERIYRITGKGSVASQGPEQNNRRKQTIFRWSLRAKEARDFVCELYPHLVAKQHQARILIGCPSSGERAEVAHAALISLHRGSTTDVDFKPPQPMFDPGWYLRSDVIWAKPNPMPESVTDRPTKAHEYLFLLAKSGRYTYDAELIKDKAKNSYKVEGWEARKAAGAIGGSFHRGNNQQHGEGISHDLGGADGLSNKRSVWTVATQRYPGAHFATFPPDLIKPCILAGCPEGGTVLDPFLGSGTTAQVARQLNCKCVGIELNEKYIALAMKRLKQKVLAFTEADDAP